MASSVTAILPGERFGTFAEFWLNLQTVHDLEEARQRLQRAACHPPLESSIGRKQPVPVRHPALRQGLSQARRAAP